MNTDIKDEINTDKKLIYTELTYKIRGAIFTVYNHLGFGHKEQVYQKALEKELTETKLPFKKEVSLNVRYKDEIVGNYRPDFVIDDKVIVELKAVEFMPKSFETQLIHYLKTTGYQLGLLVNFGSTKLVIRRLLWTGGSHPRGSAFNPRKSINGFIKLTKKTLVTMLMALIIFTSSGLYLLFFLPKSASAAWYDEGWAYRTPLTITHNASVSNQKVKFDIDTATLITNGKMQSDCGDSRFTDINGKLLRYYLDSSGGACNTASTDYYVLIPTINNGTTLIYHYYGNPTAPNGTEGANFSEATLTPSTGISAGTEAQGPGPVAYWKFDDGQGTTAQDSTTNNLDGTLNNTPTWQTENMCLAGKCLYFDGTNNENVSKSDDAILDFAAADNFTVSAWVKRNGASSANNFILTKAAAGYTGYKLYQDASGDYCFDVSDGTNTDTACTSAVEFDDDKWHLVQGVKSGTTSVTLYVDSNQRAQDTSIAATGTLANTGTFYIGVDLDGTSNEWLGFIDDVKVYNFARSAAQILQDYNSGLANAGTKQGTSAVLGSSTEKWLSDGLVGYWKEDETTNGAAATDSSGNGATLTDSATVVRTSGKFSFGGDFESASSQYQYAADNTTLSITGNLTISTWIKPESVTDSTLFDIAGKWDGDNESYLLSQFGDEIRFYVDSSSNYATTDAANLTTGTWYHVLAVYNSSTQNITIYINGATSATTTTGTIPSSIGDDTGRFHIGAEDSTTTAANFYDGVLDDVRIYNRTLSPREVSDLYNWAPGPLGYWNFDDGSGASAIDSSGNGYTASLTASPAWTTGKYGKAIDVNGSTQDARVANTAFGLTGGSFTLETWVKSDAVDASANKRVIAYATDSNNGYTLAQYVTGSGCNGRWTFEVKKSGTGYAAGCDSANNALVVANTWYHLAATFDGSSNTSTLYVNGIKQAAGSGIAYGVPGTTGTLYIGSTVGASLFDGLIDEVRVYNYARTQKQVVSDMNAGHPAVGSPVGSSVGYWKFDEGVDNTCSGGTNDTCNSGSQGSTLDGANSGAAWSQSGKFSRALSFDGTDDVVTITNSSSIDFDVGLANFSFSAWVYADTDGEGDTGQILQKGTSTYLRTDSQSGSNLDIEANLDLATTDANVNIASGITTASWNHIVTTWDGTTLTIYINGVSKGTGTGSGAISSDANNLLIGGTTTANFDGIIDEFKVYNYALTADEVKVEYNRSSSLVLGALSDNSSYQVNAANQEYCIPGDGSTCTAPVGRWGFEEKTGTSANDISGNTNTLTLTNSPTWTTGKTGAGINFAGSNAHLTRADDADFDFAAGGSFSIEGWIKHNAASAQELILSKFNEAGYKILMESDGDITCGIDYDSTWTPTDSVTSTAATYDDGKWHHIACVKNANTSLTLYIDGVSVGTPDTTLTNSTLENTDPIYIGIDADGTSNDWIGTIDEVKIFNYARSAAQVAWDYNRGKPVGWWKLDDCQSTTAQDSTDNNNDGTITIGASGEDTVGTCTTSSTAWGSGATGKRNYSLDFDGTDDYVRKSSPSGLSGDRITMAAWIKGDAFGTGVNNANIFNIEGYYLSVGNGYLNAYLSNSSSPGWHTDTNVLSTGTWYHVAVTYDSTASTAVLYLNGQAVKTVSTTGTVACCSNVWIGVRGELGATQFFNGQIDDARVYNYALTATQVKEIMNDGAVRFGPSTGAP